MMTFVNRFSGVFYCCNIPYAAIPHVRNHFPSHRLPHEKEHRIGSYLIDPACVVSDPAPQLFSKINPFSSFDAPNVVLALHPPNWRKIFVPLNKFPERQGRSGSDEHGTRSSACGVRCRLPLVPDFDVAFHPVTSPGDRVLAVAQEDWPTPRHDAAS
jgi:hypothetical protein